MRTEPANCGRFASIEGNDRSARVGLAMVQFLSGETANLSFAPKLDSGCCCPRAVRPSPIPNALGLLSCRGIPTCKGSSLHGSAFVFLFSWSPHVPHLVV